MTASHDFGRAVGGLYRVLLEPDGVLELFDAIDQVSLDDHEGDTLLDELHAQFLLAIDIYRKNAPGGRARPVEAVLLTRSHRIISLDEGAGVLPVLLRSVRVGDPFVLRDPLDQSEAIAALNALKRGDQRFLTVNVDDEAPVTIALYRGRSPTAPGDAEFFVSALQTTPWTLRVEQALRDFQLTPAEIRLLRALRGGESLPDLAHRLNLSEHTVRAQIKSVFAKVGITRQAELVRFREDVMRLSSAIGEQMGVEMKLAAATAVGQAGSHWPPRRTVQMAGGRRLSFRSYGPVDGVPVVVLHGAYSGSLIPDARMGLAHECGVRLLAPDRPGYGESDPSTPELRVQDAAREIVELAECEGFEHYAVIALAVAAAFGLEVVRSNDRAAGLVLCSPHFATADLDGAKPNLSLMVRHRLSRRAPWLTDGALRLLYDNASHAFIRRLSENIWKKSPVDHALVRDTGLDTYFADVALDARQKPTDGPIWELNALRRYRLDLAGIGCPMHLAFGTEDQITDIERMIALFESHPETGVSHFEGAGHLFFFPHWRDVLLAAKAFATGNPLVAA